jgi:hypothetical protein
LGYRFAVSSDRPALLREVERLLTGFPRCDDVDVELHLERTLAGRALDDGGIGSLVGTLNLESVRCAGGRLLLHAAGVADVHGGSLLLCGPSGSGKTTLTARLLERGWAYLSDETICLDPRTLSITPYRKPLTVKPGAQELLRHLRPERDSTIWYVPPTTLNAVEPAKTLLPELIVFPTYKAATSLASSALDAAETAYLAGTNSSRLRDVPEPLAALACFSRRVPGYRLTHSDADDAADAVERLWADVA